MMLEYMEKIVMFKETPEGLTTEMDWLHEAGDDGWELVTAIPLIAPNRSRHQAEPSSSMTRTTRTPAVRLARLRVDRRWRANAAVHSSLLAGITSARRRRRIRTTGSKCRAVEQRIGVHGEQ